MNDALDGIYNYRAVDESIATSGQPSVAQLRAIAEAGFATVINLALHDDPRYSLPDEPGTVRSLGMNYVHIPVQFFAPTEANLLAFFEAMEAHRDVRIWVHCAISRPPWRGRHALAHRDVRIWVHCAANMRVSAFLGLFRVIKQGRDHEQAFALMHDLWRPNAVWSSFISTMLEKHGGRKA